VTSRGELAPRRACYRRACRAVEYSPGACAGQIRKAPLSIDSESGHRAGYNRSVLGLTLPDLLSRLITLVLALTFHELAHAVVATRLGDPTAAQLGRVSLNPLRHLDPLGSLMLVAVEMRSPIH